jgi:hypothetical protein
MAAQTPSAGKELQYLLETLDPGDVIEIADASRATGVDEATCETVFDALVRVGLFTRTSDGVLVRRRMFDALED